MKTRTHWGLVCTECQETVIRGPLTVGWYGNVTLVPPTLPEQAEIAAALARHVNTTDHTHYVMQDFVLLEEETNG